MKAYTRIPIIPVNLDRTPQPEGVPVPKPSIEHTLVDCEECECQGWVGPAQRISYLFAGGIYTCYGCIAEDMRAGGTDIEIHSLDATADEKPRRT